MANSDKNILITPNIGSSSDPKIEFKGADTSTGPSTITAVVYPTNNGTLSFNGSVGELFSITNNLTSGSIFAVNDVSGVPSIDVNADGTISLGPYGGNIGIGTLTPSSKLSVVGNASISGTLDLGHASDTTLTRVSAGVVSIEGVNIVTTSSTDTLTNKTLTSPTLTTPVLGTPSSGTLTNCTFPTLNQNTTGSAGSVDFNNLTSKASGSGTYTTSGDFRAPIFYDSNDTTYYGDFASTSWLRHLSVGDINATNDGSWNARLNLTGSSHARLDVKSNSDGIITTMYSHTGQGVGRVGTYSNHPCELMAQSANVGGYIYNGSLRAPLFYDSGNTGYYTDPASTSRMNAISLDQVNVGDGTFLFTTGANSGTTRHLNLSTYGGDPSQAHSGQSGITWGYRTDSSAYYMIHLTHGDYSAHTKLTLSWHTGIRIGADPSYGGTAFYNNSLNASPSLIFSVGRGDSNVRVTNDIRSPIYYDSDNTAYYTDPASTSNLNGLTVAATITGSVTGTSSNITAYTINQSVGTGNGPTFADVYVSGWFRNNASGYGLYNQATGMHWYSDSANYLNMGAGQTSHGIRFRDNHAGTIRGYLYYNNSSEKGFLNSAGSWSVRVDDSHNTQIYGYLTVGSSTSSDIYMTDTDEGTRRIHCNTERIGFLNQANGWGAYCSDNGDWTTDTISYAGASMRAPIFYDSDNTAYYTDPASTSNLNGLTVAATITGSVSGNAATATNVAYSGLTGTVPTWNQNTTGSAGSVDFNNLTSKASGSGTYTTSGDFRAPIFYDSANTAYYCDPNSTSTLYHLILSGASYFRPQTWIQMDGSYGMYWPNTNGAHLEGNTLSTYGSIAIRGSRGSWRGIHFYDGGNTPHLMFDGSANGGIYYETGGRWGQYYLYSHNCWGFGTSTTSSAYNIYCPTGVYSGGRVDGTIFYDSNNTAYYTDPASTSNLNSVTAVDFNSTSDIKLKTNVTQISNSIEKISQLNGVSFNWKNTNKPSLGVIAQEVEKVFPELVNDSETKTVNYNGLIGVLIEAIKEQQIQINYLKEMIINNNESN